MHTRTLSLPFSQRKRQTFSTSDTTHFIDSIYVVRDSHIHSVTCILTHTHCHSHYGVASISRLLKIIRLFCKRDLQKRLYSAEETYNFKEPTNRSHPIRKRRILSTSDTTYFIDSIYIVRDSHIQSVTCIPQHMRCHSHNTKGEPSVRVTQFSSTPYIQFVNHI